MSCNDDLDYLNRFAIMLKEEQLKKLTSANIIIFGVGGVGGAVAHFLVRSGIQNLSVVDFDVVDITNINRQLVANIKNLGKLKVKKQLKNINPNLRIKTYPIKYSDATKNNIDLTQYDYIIDCIDDLTAKKLLILEANEKKIPIISAMGAGNRYAEIPNFEVTDISKTSYDPIAKILRKFCSNERIKHLDVCYTKQKAIKNDCKIVASVVYYPLSMACVITAFVINKIIGR